MPLENNIPIDALLKYEEADFYNQSLEKDLLLDSLSSFEVADFFKMTYKNPHLIEEWLETQADFKKTFDTLSTLFGVYFNNYKPTVFKDKCDKYEEFVQLINLASNKNTNEEVSKLNREKLNNFLKNHPSIKNFLNQNIEKLIPIAQAWSKAFPHQNPATLTEDASISEVSKYLYQTDIGVAAKTLNDNQMEDLRKRQEEHAAKFINENAPQYAQTSNSNTSLESVEYLVGSLINMQKKLLDEHYSTNFSHVDSNYFKSISTSLKKIEDLLEMTISIIPIEKRKFCEKKYNSLLNPRSSNIEESNNASNEDLKATNFRTVNNI